MKKTYEIETLGMEIDLIKDVLNDLSTGQENNNAAMKKLVTGIGSYVKNEINSQMHEQFESRTKEIETNILYRVDDSIDNKIRAAVNARGLNRQEMNKLTSARNLRFRQLLGDSKGDNYLLLISFYQGAMIKGYRKLFHCGAYGDIDPNRFFEALTYIRNFTVTQSYYDWSIDTLHKQYRDGEIENKKKFNAYERFFGIRVI